MTKKKKKQGDSPKTDLSQTRVGNSLPEASSSEEEAPVEVEGQGEDAEVAYQQAGDDIEVLPPEVEVPAGGVETQPEEVSPRTDSIVKYDPLEAYLREIRAYPALSREEEQALALKYRSSKDIESAYKLVTSNLWLVVKIARDYEKAARSLLDLIQEGNIGLMEAVKNFDPLRGVRFPSYAAWWIKAYIVRFVIANWRLVKIGTTQAQRRLFFNLHKEKERLEREGFKPAPKLLAEKLNVKESEVIEMEQRLSSADVSVNAPVHSDSEATVENILPSQAESMDDALGEKQLKALIEKGFKEFASTLKPSEQLIFSERMLAEEKATLQDISEKLSISRERVRQIENRLKEKLKAFLQDKYGAVIEQMEF